MLLRSASACDSPSRAVPDCWPKRIAHTAAHAMLAARPARTLRIVLELEPNIRKDREQNPIGGNISKPLEWHQPIDAAGDHHVLRKRWTICEPDTRVGANPSVNIRLEQQQFQWIGVGEAQQIQVDEAAQLRSDVDIHSRIVEEQSRIHEVRLPLRFAGAKIRHQATGPLQAEAGGSEPDAS